MLKVISLDLDGTIFPNNIDDKLWFEIIPMELAKVKGMSIESCVEYLKEEYDKIGPHDPRWYIPEYWLDRFGLTIDIDSLLNKMCYEDYIYQDVSVLNRYDLKIVVTTTNARSIMKKKVSIIDKFLKIEDSFSVVSDLNLTCKNEIVYEHVSKRLCVEREEIMHVGDNPVYDLINARKAGLRSILIDRKFELEGSDVIHSFEDLALHINKYVT